MSRLSNWANSLWKSIRWDYVLKSVQKLLVAVAGTIGKRLTDAALSEVRRAEASGKSGIEKYEMAYKGLKDNPDFRHLPKYALNIAIESAVALLFPKANEYGFIETH